MQELINSDLDLTMLATKSFHHIIDEVQSSCLNYQLQISPFSAVISLKKSVLRDISGKPLLPTKLKHDTCNANIENLVAKNIELERELKCLLIKHEKVVDENNEKKMKFKVEEASSFLIEELESEKNMLKDALKARDDEIHNLQLANKAAKEASVKLSKALGEIKVKFEKEKATFEKRHRSEIKSWRKDLGNANSKIVGLEKKLEHYRSATPISPTKSSKMKSKKVNVKINETVETKNNTLCSICGLSIPLYVPEYFLGEKYNPTCTSCKASDSSWDPDDSFASFSSSCQPSSLVSHWIPLVVKTPQRPGSLSSMITHCALLPPPGSSFISMEEVLEMMKEFFRKPWFTADAI